MAVLKKYVRNCSRPEGCIAKGYGTKEVIEFCIDFIDDLNPIGVLMSRHEGRLKGKGILGKKSNMHLPESEIRKANFTVLQNSSLMTPYMDEHINIVRSENQNSGVRIDPIGNDGNKDSYFGVIEEIWKLDYGPLMIPLFRCQRVNRDKGIIKGP